MKFDISKVYHNPSTKIQVTLKSDNINGFFTWRPMSILGKISPNPSQNEKLFNKF